MPGFLCSMVGASFLSAQVEVLRAKKGITAVGNAQVSTAQSKFGGASAVFDGTGDLLQLDTSAALTIPSSANFTIEGWIRPGSVSGTPGLLTDRASHLSLTGVNWDISVFNGTYITPRTNTLLFESASGSIVIISNNNVLTTNTLYHFAVVRNSNVITLYVDGVDVTNIRAGTQSAAIGAGNLTMGGFPSGGAMYTGHMDEIRWSNTARYTANFTPSTVAFVNDANTLLLIHADGTNGSTFFEDDNGVRAPKGLSAIGNAQISTAQNKFGNSSYLGDGTGDHLFAAPANDLQFTGNFTVELFVRLVSTGAIRVPIGNRGGSPGAGIWWVEVGSDQTGYTAWQNTAGTSYYPAFSGTISVNTWTHLAIVRNGNTLTFYKDGVGGTPVTVTGTFGLTNGGIFIGGIASSFNWNGYLDEVRISNSARYTGNFTPSTTAFVNDANTVLLLHMDGTNGSTVFRDDVGVRSQTGIHKINDVVISTTQSKFGGSSLQFTPTSGTTVNVSFDSQLMGLTNGGDFTVELQAYFLALPNTGGSGYMMFYSANPEPYVLFTNTLVGPGAGGYPSFAFNFAINTWYHVAISRASGSMKCFVNGTQAGATVTGSTYNYIPVGNNTGVRFGKFSDDRGLWNGFMDEIRFSKVARYTANFTAPTQQFVNDADTLLLIHGDGTNASTVITDDNGVAPFFA